MYHLLSFLYSVFESVIFLLILAVAMIFIIPLGWWGFLACVVLVGGGWPLLSYIFAYLSYPLMKLVNKHNVEGVAFFVFSVFGIAGAIAPWILLWFSPSWSNALCASALTILDYDMFNGVIAALKAAKD